MSSNTNRRKIYLINPRFQYSFILFSSAVGFISLCIFYFAIMYFFWSFERRGIVLGIPSEHIFFRFIDEERNLMNLIFVIAATLVLITTSISALILSNRVAGPLYRLKKHIKRLVNEDQLEPVQFRKGDFFIELEETFNEFIASLNAKKSSQNKNMSSKDDKIE